MSLIGKSEAEALAALKAANSAEVDGLRVANSQLLGHHEQINLELDMQKSLLNKTLIQLNTHRDHLDESQSTEFKKTLDILKAATRDAGHDGTDYEAMKRRITQQEEEIESGTTLLSEQLKVLNHIIEDSPLVMHMKSGKYPITSISIASGIPRAGNTRTDHVVPSKSRPLKDTLLAYES